MTTEAALLSPSAAAREVLARRQARAGVMPFCVHCWNGYQPARHLALLGKYLEEVERGETLRLMVEMPPRHGKSLTVSQLFPAWFLGRGPNRRVIMTAYGDALAGPFSRNVRNVIMTQRYQRLFEHVQLAKDSKSAGAWDLAAPHRGGMISAGIGSGITGHGADLLIIDDPFKNREEADSGLYRERIWNWYTDTARTRLQPGGAVILVMCMTGDTPVMLPDGSSRPLAQIRPGDRIATYDDGVVSTSIVRNWKNQGPDRIYAIHMESGIIVRANARHPFLVEVDGERRWQRTDTLEPGSVILKVTGASGAGLPALKQDAIDRLFAKDSARPTTTSGVGPTDTGQHQSTRRRVERHDFATAMALDKPSSMRSSPSRAASVLCVSSPPIQRIPAPIGAASSASITAMKPIRSEACSATTVTSWSDMAGLRIDFSPPLSTYAIVPDRVIEVVDAGVEDVFDIQVDRTENFIADGLISHNTRWHHDDLAGRLIKQGGWTVLRLQAVAEEADPLGRAAGEALWPEGHDPERTDGRGFDRRALDEIKRETSARGWAALYQQQPLLDEGQMFPRGRWLRYKPAETVFPGSALTVQAWDTAWGTGVSSDWSVGATWTRVGQRLFLRNVHRVRVDYPDLKAAMRSQFKLHKPQVIYVEDSASGKGAVQELRREGLPVVPVPAVGSKESRADAVTPLITGGLVFIPEDEYAPWVPEFVSEHEMFPAGGHDDQVDTTSIALLKLRLMTSDADRQAIDEGGDASGSTWGPVLAGELDRFTDAALTAPASSIFSNGKEHANGASPLREWL